MWERLTSRERQDATDSAWAVPSSHRTAYNTMQEWEMDESSLSSTIPFKPEPHETASQTDLEKTRHGVKRRDKCSKNVCFVTCGPTTEQRN